jgi:ArsR family transcriptional regulator, arsenate/arsenite/antimonite-responsive transcriptional repressor
MSLSPVFKALNDPTRREILELLRRGDLNAGEIAGHFNISAPSISHHLELLKNAGLISSRKQGQFLIYTLNSTVLDDILEWIIRLQKPKKNKHKP